MKKKILIVDGNGEARMAICKFLEPEYEIMIAGDGIEALEILQNYHPDIIIADLEMPELSGLVFVGLLSKRYRIIAMAEEGGIRCLNIARERGAKTIFHRPFRLADLRYEIEQLL